MLRESHLSQFFFLFIFGNLFLCEASFAQEIPPVQEEGALPNIAAATGELFVNEGKSLPEQASPQATSPALDKTSLKSQYSKEPPAAQMKESAKDTHSKINDKKSKQVPELDQKKMDILRSYFEAKEYHKAFPILARLKNTTNPDILFALGRVFENGWGTKADYAQARGYYLKAAKKGIAAAWGRLGVLTFEGLGGKANKKAAEKLFHKGCQGKDQESCWRLVLLKDTEGLDPQAKGNPEIVLYLFEKGDYETAIPELQKMQDNPKMMEALAKAYHFGWGVKKDFVQAKNYYEKALALKYGPGAFGLGRMYETGEGFAKDTALADYYYEMSCNLGFKRGCKKRYGGR